jgi:hypothetical protein
MTTSGNALETVPHPLMKKRYRDPVQDLLAEEIAEGATEIEVSLKRVLISITMKKIRILQKTKMMAKSIIAITEGMIVVEDTIGKGNLLNLGG